MKEKIHPKLNKVVFLDVTNGAEFITTSTLSSKETKEINGSEHFVIRVETSSATHPFYTGKKRNEVKNDQVAKFMAKVAKAQEKNKPKKASKADLEQGGKTTKKTATKKTTKADKK